MKRLLPSLAFAAALLAAVPASAQQAQYPTGQGNTTAPGVTLMCVNSQGFSVPLALCDQWPGVTGSFQGAAQEQRARVVAMSPNSGSAQDYPTNAVPVTASTTGTTAATTATIAAVPGRKAYLCGFSIRANATAAATGNATVTGLITGTLNFTQWTAPLASGLGITEPPIGPRCIPASGVNQAVAVVSAAPGSGGVVSVSAWGYYQ